MWNQNFPCAQDTCRFDHEFLRLVEDGDGETTLLAKKKSYYRNSGKSLSFHSDTSR